MIKHERKAPAYCPLLTIGNHNQWPTYVYTNHPIIFLFVHHSTNHQIDIPLTLSHPSIKFTSLIKKYYLYLIIFHQLTNFIFNNSQIIDGNFFISTFSLYLYQYKFLLKFIHIIYIHIINNSNK